MKKTLAALLLILSTSCSTTVPVEDSAHPSAAPNTTVAIPIWFKSTHPLYGKDGCTISFRQGESFKDYTIDVKPGPNLIFADFPAGATRFHELLCGGKTWRFAFEHIPNFQAYEGKVSLLGGLDLTIDEQKYSRAHFQDRGKDRDTALSLFERLPAERRGSVVSAYTGQPIQADSVAKPARWKNWTLKDGDEKDIKTHDWPTFKTCYTAEFDMNALRLGDLKANAEFKDSAFVKVEFEDWNSFTDRFKPCVESLLQNYHPENKAELHYTLYL